MYMAARPRRGLGNTGTSIVSTGATTAGAFTGQIAGSTGLTALLGASVAVPVVGAAIAGVALLVTAWMNRRGPVQKIQTTHIVDEAEPFLQQNLNAYLSGPRTISNQNAAKEIFNTIWARMVAECSQPQFGDPGQRCINDRKRGSTKGYDWFALYYDPIANDTQVVADPGPLASIFPNTPGIPTELLLGAGLLALALVVTQ